MISRSTFSQRYNDPFSIAFLFLLGLPLMPLLGFHLIGSAHLLNRFFKIPKGLTLMGGMCATMALSLCWLPLWQAGIAIGLTAGAEALILASKRSTKGFWHSDNPDKQVILHVTILLALLLTYTMALNAAKLTS